MFVHVDGKIIYCNVAAMNKFGYDDMSELYGKDSRALVYEGGHALMAERRKKRLAEGGASAPEEFRFVRRDGSVFYGETSAAPVTWQGKAAAIVAMVDLTERRKAEEALRERRTLSHAPEYSARWCPHKQRQPRPDRHPRLIRSPLQLHPVIGCFAASLPA